jgi:hypothetical protein
VRWPLHAAVSLTSFALTLSAGASGVLWLRVACVLADAAVIAAFERSSRAHFVARRFVAAAGKPRKRSSLKAE